MGTYSLFKQRLNSPIQFYVTNIVLHSLTKDPTLTLGPHPSRNDSVKYPSDITTSSYLLVSFSKLWCG